MAVQAGVRVSGGSRPDDYPLWVQADPDMLHQAVLNLAVNAIEACGEGTDVTVGACEVGRGPSPCRSIEVRDTGPGIAAEDVGRIFQPFFTTKTAGTGLGLAVADNIARSHGGRIDVESSPETGTVFRIVLSDRLPLQISGFVAEEVGA
jgi:signal transduction histidine kinase